MAAVKLPDNWRENQVLPREHWKTFYKVYDAAYNDAWKWIKVRYAKEIKAHKIKSPASFARRDACGYCFYDPNTEAIGINLHDFVLAGMIQPMWGTYVFRRVGGYVNAHSVSLATWLRVVLVHEMTHHVQHYRIKAGKTIIYSEVETTRNELIYMAERNAQLLSDALRLFNQHSKSPALTALAIASRKVKTVKRYAPLLESLNVFEKESNSHDA